MKSKFTFAMLLAMALFTRAQANTMYYCAPNGTSVEASAESPALAVLHWVRDEGATCHPLTGYEIQVKMNHVTTDYYALENEETSLLSYMLNVPPGEAAQWRVRSIYAPGNGIERHSTWSRGPDINSTSEKMEPWGDESEINISVFPNPAFENLNFGLVAEMRTEISIDIFNTTGQKVQHNQFTLERGSSVTDFDISSLSQGIYYVSISDGNKTRTSKIIKL